MTGLERYRDIVPDWGSFLEAVRATEPTALRVRHALVTPSVLLRRLQDQGFDLRPAGVDGYLVVERGPGSVAQTVEHWLGLFHIQQSVMGLPSLALAPEAGDRVLDLCAAPGGKTTHLSELMDERGPLVAMDPKEKRLRGLLGNIYRLGNSNIVVVAADGRDLPGGIGFDRVLVDAPCSGEGNVRKQGGRVAHRSESFQAHIGELQESLLRRAIAATRPGGTIVYSTCTFAPEENEAIVSRVLENEPVEALPIGLTAPHSEGLAEWEGRRFHPDVRFGWRVYPHQLDSGGLFMARLRKTEGGSVQDDLEARAPQAHSAWSSLPKAFPGMDPEAAEQRVSHALSELEHRFGYDRSFLESLGWMERRENVWAQTADEWPIRAFEEGASGRWRIVSVGLRALKRSRGGHETPSSAFLTRWSRELPTTRRLELDSPRLRALLAGGRIPAETDIVGPVAIVWSGLLLGRGMVNREGRLWHEFGKSQSQRLARLLGLASVNGKEGGDE